MGVCVRVSVRVNYFCIDKSPSGRECIPDQLLETDDLYACVLGVRLFCAHKVNALLHFVPSTREAMFHRLFLSYAVLRETVSSIKRSIYACKC